MTELFCENSYRLKAVTAKNTVISPNFLVWKFCGKAQLPHSFARFARNYAENEPFCKIFTPGNQVKLRYFSQCVIGSCVDLLIANSEFPFMKTQSFEISFSDYHHMNILFSKQNLRSRNQ